MLKWLRNWIQSPPAIESVSRFSNAIEKLRHLKPEVFESVYSSDMALIRWSVMYGDIFTYIRHLNEGSRNLTVNHLDPNRFNNDPEWVSVSDFSLQRGYYCEDIVSEYKELQKALIDFLTLYEKHKSDSDSITCYNIMVLTKLISNSLTLVDHLLHYPL